MPKKQMKFKSGGKVKRYAEGEEVDGESIFRKEMRDRDDSSMFMNDTNTGVLRALRGERPPAPEYTQLPPSKDNKFAKAVQKAQKSNAEIRSSEADLATSRGARPGISQIPGQSMTAEQREGINRGERVTGTETSRNISNALSALTPFGGGALKVGNELALGGRSAKAAQALQSEGKLSAAGQRLKNMEEVRNVAMPGRAEAVMNPSAWAGGPKAMEKIAQAEGRAAAAEARAATAAAKKKAAQAKKDAKDPVMNARPGADKAKSKSKYETDEAMDSSFGYKKGGVVKKFAKGGSVSSASSRADGCAIRGKTKGMISKMKSGGMYGGKGAC